MRTESYLQHETNDFDNFEPAQVKRTLTIFENLVHYNSDPDSDTVSIFLSSKSHYFNLHLATTVDQRTIAAGLKQPYTVPKAAGCPSYNSAT